MIVRDKFCKFCIKTYFVTPRRDGLVEGSQHVVSIRNKKNYPSVIIKYSYLEVSVHWDKVAIAMMKFSTN